jgi:hypothetical protein
MIDAAELRNSLQDSDPDLEPQIDPAPLRRQAEL